MISEAIEPLEYAETLYVIAADKARALLYLADMHRRDGHVDESNKISNQLIQHKAYKNVPAVQAAKTLLEQMCIMAEANFSGVKC